MLRRTIAAFGPRGGPGAFDLELRESGPPPEAIRAVVLRGAGALPRRSAEASVSIQEQAADAGFDGAGTLRRDVRLGAVPSDERSGQATPAAGSRRLSASVRARYR